MKATEAKQLLEKYFEAQTSMHEEQQLSDYFLSGNVDEEFAPYVGLFAEIEEMKHFEDKDSIEQSVMEYVLQYEKSAHKSRLKQLWISVSGIAAMLLVSIGGVWFYQQQQPYKDTFDNPEEAMVYIQTTLHYVSSKYQEGMAELQQFDKLKEAIKPLENGMYNLSQGFNVLSAISDEVLQSGNTENNGNDF